MLRSSLCLLTLCCALSAPALTVRPPSFEELTRAAEAILVAEVSNLEMKLEPVEGRPVPFTYVTLAVTETLKGPPTATVVLRCLGGQVGENALRVVGVPEFAVGDRGFFFVQNNGTQFFPLVGITHGLYWEIHDAVTGVDFVTRANGAPLHSTADVSRPLPDTRQTRTTGGMTSALFREKIKAEMQHATR